MREDEKGMAAQLIQLRHREVHWWYLFSQIGSSSRRCEAIYKKNSPENTDTHFFSEPIN